MPIIYKEYLINGSIIGVWQITETVDELLRKVTLNENEQKNFVLYKNENRKKHWLSYRVLIKELIEENYHISYTDFGKPYLNLTKKNNHISITHSGEYSAVIINEHHSVGIDIELSSKRVERVAERFLSEEELCFIDSKNTLDHLTICWTAKEALFKIHGNLCYDFKKDIALKPFRFAEKGEIFCTILDQGKSSDHKVFYRKLNSCYLAFVTV